VLDPVGSLSPALPPTPAPEPVGDPATRDIFVAACHRAGLSNVLLSFAQFEREVIGERIRDKIAASKKKGMWMGGVPPLGYGVQDHKLVMIGSEADTVRLIFRRYAELGSVRLLKAELEARQDQK
jgi:DNA invertase Pin-like site-specific DNA recombinase